MEIPPSSSLIAALSEFTENRSTAATTAAKEARQQDKTKAEAQETRRANDSATANQRVQVSSERELEAARDAAREADEQAILRREAPTAGVEKRHQPPGQIIDISV